jgi:Alpha amylase, catalytic domain
MPSLRTLLLAFTLSTTAFSQTLARPGWAGSGMNAAPWWRHAVLYQLDPQNFSENGLKSIPIHLDYLQSLGIDAILLTNTAPDAQTIDPALGTLDDLDDLIHQASRRNIRVLIDLKPKPSTDLTATARFWLNRGVAGFHIANPTEATLLRKVTNTYVGQRIVITDLDPANPPKTQQNSTSDPHLLFDPRPGTQPQLTAATIRPALEAIQDLRILPVLLTDGPDLKRSMARYADGTHDLEIAKTLAAILLTSRAAANLYYGQELGLTETYPTIHWEAPPAPQKGHPAPPPDPNPNAAVQDANPQSLLNWYRQLSVLHHGNATIASGASILLNHDDQNVLVWVRKPPAVTAISPAMVVICNLTAQPVQLSLKADMQRLHLKGSFLRTTLRSDNAMGPMHLESMTIPPYAVYIGELRY